MRLEQNVVIIIVYSHRVLFSCRDGHRPGWRLVGVIITGLILHRSDGSSSSLSLVTDGRMASWGRYLRSDNRIFIQCCYNDMYTVHRNKVRDHALMAVISATVRVYISDMVLFQHQADMM